MILRALRTRQFSQALLATLLAFPAVAEEVALQARMTPGAAYRLSLAVVTDTEAFSKGGSGETYEEKVRLQYRADVTVLDVDAQGRPTRERHDHASLTFERPGESGSLFKENVSLGVERRNDIEVSLAGKRVAPELEKVLSDVLEKQFEFTLEPALLDPGRSVEVGESWAPDESLARRFLQSRGVRVAAFGEDAVVKLVRETREDGQSALVVDYRIPISRFALTRMPAHTEASRSEALLAGRIELAREPGRPPVSARSNLTLSLNGTSRTPAQSMPWGVRSSVTVEKSHAPKDDLASIGSAPQRLR